MKTKEWANTPKDDWRPGPWLNEPDKVQWVDEETGLDCLIVRGPSGVLCGYVGVPPEHPWHGVDYNQCLIGDACEEEFCWDHRPESKMEVHGGLAYSAACQEPYTEEEWEEKRQDPKWVEYMERRGYPDDPTYEEYVEWARGTAICHVAEEGRPEDVWWFGFDCSHLGDVSPGFGSTSGVFHEGTYKTRGYVESEVRGLARQLHSVAA